MANAMFNNPWTLLGAGMMRGADPRGEALGGLGYGLLNTASIMRDQQNLAYERARQQELANAQMQLYASQMETQRQKQAEMARQQQGIEGLVKAYPEYEPIIRAGYGSDVAAMQTREPSTEAPVAVIGPDGQPIYTTRQEALGMQPYKSPLVSVGSEEETKEEEVVGEFFGQTYVDLQQAGRAARDSNAKLNRLDQLMDQTYTGKGAGALLAARKALSLLGRDVEGIGEAEAASALSGELALQLRNPAGGAGMPGAMSDRDREFLQSMTPNLAITKEGRKLMIETKRKLNKRSEDVARLAREYRKKYGRIDEGFEDVLVKFANENPLFTSDAAQGESGVVDWSDL